MDNSMTTWIIVALLVLLIGAAIFMLLRRPGGDDDAVDGRDAPVVDRAGDGDRARRDDLGGRTAPEETQAVAPEDRPARDDQPFDQASYDTPGETPLTPEEKRIAEEYRAPEEQRTTDEQAPDEYRADDFLGVDEADRDRAPGDPAYQDPRTEGHVIAEDPTIGAGHTAAPATEGYDARPAAEEAYEAHPAQAEDTAAPGIEDRHDERHDDHDRHGSHGSHDGEPLTADEVLDARGVDDTDTGEGYAAPPVEPDRTDAGPDSHQAHEAPQAHAHDQDHAHEHTHGHDEHGHDQHRGTSGAFTSGTGAPAAATAASAPANVDEPVVEEDRDPAAAGGEVFAESVYGPGSVEPAEDGSGPEGWEIKGNTGSMLFHTADSPSYDAVRAEVWFDSEESARNAGFAHWDRRRR